MADLIKSEGRPSSAGSGQGRVSEPTQAPAAGGHSTHTASTPVSTSDFTQTQAFRDAVAKATSEAVARATSEIMAKLQSAQTLVGTASTSPAQIADDTSFVRKLALEIVGASDQGNRHNKRISPEETLKREAAQARMLELVTRFRAEDVTPTYELKAPTYLEERLVPPTWTDRNHVQRKTQIGWPGIPNEAMTPLNDAAQAIFTAYRSWIGGPAPSVTHLSGKGGSLKVLHEPDGGNVPHVGKPRGGDLAILGRDMPDDVKEINVLGTVARPARQAG